MEEYIDINKIAEAKGLKSTRAIRLKIQRGQYIAREITVQGGKSYEILFESLEYDIQALVKENPEPFYYPTIPVKSFVPDTAKTIALARIDLIKQWGTFRIKYSPLKEATLQYKNAALVVQAIKATDKDNITNYFLKKLRGKFSREEWRKIKKDSVKAPLWVYNYISKIA